MSEIWALPATEMAARIHEGRLTSVELVKSCLDRIAVLEDVVQAWEWLDPGVALEQAKKLDGKTPRGPLHGIPVAVKDIIDTADMPTGYGSSIYADHHPKTDADCVARARAAGAVILGKTVTTEFATFRPPKTCNPHDLERTPGGSSSGSAAAVAAGMVPLAFGTQTVGSVLRPASFCGVVGFKAGFGRFDLSGVKQLTASLDSLGFFTRSVGDAALFSDAIAGEPQPGLIALPGHPLRIALIRTGQWDHASDETRAAVKSTAKLLADEGAIVTEPDLPETFTTLAEVQDVIFRAGAVRALAREWRDHRKEISPQLVALLEQGEAISETELAHAEKTAEICRWVMDDLFKEHDLALAPAAPGEAPLRKHGTGDPLFNRMWTLLHNPCLSLPGQKGPNGMPVGVQLVGPRGGDRQLLACADWVAARMQVREAAQVSL